MVSSMEDKLIKLVQENPHLYDKSDKSYKDVAKSENTWEIIRVKLGLPDDGPNRAKKRWSTLRQKFSREIKKNSSRSGPRKRQWQYWEPMSFLKDHMECKETSTNFGTNGIKGEWSGRQLDKEENVILDAHYSVSDTSRPSSASTTESNESSGPSASKKEKTNTKIRISDVVHQPSSETSTVWMQPHEEDDIDAFMRASAMALKKLTRGRYLRAKRQINNIITDLEEDQLFNN